MQVSKINELNSNDISFKHKINDGKTQIKIVNSKTGYTPIMKTEWFIVPFDPSSYSRNHGTVGPVTDIVFQIKNGGCYRTMELSNSDIKYDYDENKFLNEKFFIFC